MKTRVISTEIWDEDEVFSLNIDTKLLYLILLTNPYIGQTRYYKISDRQLSTFSGLNVEQIQKCKRDLSESSMVHFKDGWVCITGYGFIECFYKGEKNEKAKEKEMEKIPPDVISFFNERIGYQYPIDTTINTKSEIINNKSRIITKKSEIEKQKFGEFRNVLLSEDEYAKLIDGIGEKNTNAMIFELSTYLASNGKKKYASHYATILNWIRRKGLELQEKKQIQESKNSRYQSSKIY